MWNPSILRSSTLDAVRGIRDTLSQRPDSEHEQAIIRLVIVFLLTIYVSLSVGLNHRINANEIPAAAIAAGCLLFSASLFIHIIVRPGTSPLRRAVGMTHDNGMAAYMMYTLGEYSAPFYIILLWVTFGNGFRYGRKYLFASAILGSAFFSLVINTTEYWEPHPTLGYGLLLGLIVLPLYISSLLKKLTAALSRAEEANRAKNQFLANMSHEMRTPLSGILGMVDLLRGTPLTAEQRDYASTIHASSKTLLFLIEDVLDISKIEAGKISVETIDLDLHSLIKGTVAMVAHQARQKGLDLLTQIPSRTPFLLRGDPLLLRQVLLNLLSNAVKFTEAGEVCLRVEQIRETPEKVSLRIEVSDTGIGIPPKAQTRIFERFTQADDSITRRYGGTGLGTTIAKQLVELMGGEIGLHSEPGKGSTFWFTLNLEKQAPEASLETGARPVSGSRILIISSDGNSSFVLRTHLASWGADAVVADKAAQAFSPLIAAVNDGVPFQVAFIVEKGLDMDPCELARALKSVRIVQNVQLILVSKEENEPDLSFLSKFGFSAAVGASLDKTLLFNAVHIARPVDGYAEDVPSLADRYRQKKEGERQGLRVLVAEDNPTNQKVIAKILERAGHRPYLVENGEQALDAMEKETFDLVLLDLHMPVMGGVETAKILRFTRRGTSRPPLVALTADATRESRNACEEAGFDAYLTKPVEIKKLNELLGSLVTKGREGLSVTAAVQAPPAGNGEPEGFRDGRVIDPATFNELAALAGQEDFLEKLIRIFLETGEQKIESIAKAMLAGNYGRVSELAHALKGSAGQIGASSLMELCGRISHGQTAYLMNEGNEIVEVLRNEFERARAALHEHLQEAGPKDTSHGMGGKRERNSGEPLPYIFRNR